MPVGDNTGILHSSVVAKFPKDDRFYGYVVRDPRLSFTAPSDPPASRFNDLDTVNYNLAMTSGPLQPGTGIPGKPVKGFINEQAFDFSVEEF